MDDLTKKISELLNSPEGMQKIQSMAASMGVLGDSNQSPSPPAAPVSASPDLSSLLNGLGGGGSGGGGSGGGGGDMDMIRKLMPLLSNFGQDNKDTLLLKALRPYLVDDRQHRLDETIKIMQLLKMLPILKDKGDL